MPIVNTYYSDDKQKEMVLSHINDLKSLVAEQLTCSEIELKAHEVTIHLIETPVGGMIAEMELEILAHAFRERVEKQDEICRVIRLHILKNVPELEEIRVWLALSELGHSW